MENKMNTWAIVVGSFTIIGVIITVLILFYNSINSKIEEKINDPNFVKKVASEIQLPFLIFDESERIIYDNNAYNLINSIKVEKQKEEIVSITIFPKAFMQIPPIIESVNSDLNFDEPERVNQIDWRFKVNTAGGAAFVVIDSHKKLIKKFKLTLIKK
jgi:hypothetical protein